MPSDTMPLSMKPHRQINRHSEYGRPESYTLMVEDTRSYVHDDIRKVVRTQTGDIVLRYYESRQIQMDKLTDEARKKVERLEIPDGLPEMAERGNFSTIQIPLSCKYSPKDNTDNDPNVEKFRGLIGGLSLRNGELPDRKATQFHKDGDGNVTAVEYLINRGNLINLTHECTFAIKDGRIKDQHNEDKNKKALLERFGTPNEDAAMLCAAIERFGGVIQRGGPDGPGGRK